MRFSFVNPNWDFGGSTYFGCRDPHVPLELMFAAQQVRAAGHEAQLIDAQTENIDLAATRTRVDSFDPDFVIIPTAPSYLFWRCPPPEVRIPKRWIAGLPGRARKVIIGPHSSATPLAALRKTGADIAFRGEPDMNIPRLADTPWEMIEGCCFGNYVSPSLGVTEMKSLAPLDFADYPVEMHWHRHHVFTGEGRGAELEFARGCPWSCTFCNKTLFRNRFRERDVDAVLAEVDALVSRGVDYIYFIDEIFGVGKNVRRLLEGIAERNVQIGFQTRIDLWTEETLDLLGRARCISFECGIESITDAGRDELNKNCRMQTDRITELLIYARTRIPWVQANLILTDKDDKAEIRKWQDHLKSHGVWVSEPVPMYPFPGSPLYVQTFGAQPDDDAWERAHTYYMQHFGSGDFSDIQDANPQQLETLECTS
jgi:B12-binding domain/radical SAM domain protein of rhizo-twelve system